MRCLGGQIDDLNYFRCHMYRTRPIQPNILVDVIQQRIGAC
uniref:Uncharacterized protein n=1 Tax=Arundo donax TaxID=35708 RepID=A0A0A9BKK5_ARUDO